MGVKELSNKRTTLYWLPINKLKVVEGWNIRIDYGNIDEFARYILQNGISYPPFVGYMEGDEFIVTQGHRRRLATLKAVEMGLTLPNGVPCLLEAKTASPEEQIAQQISTNDGKNYTPLEKALVCKKLSQLGCDTKRIVQITGMNTASVYNYVNYVCPQPESVINLIKSGKVAISTVIDIAREIGVKKTYNRLLELDGKDPLVDSLIDSIQVEDDSNITVYSDLSDFEPKKKSDKIRQPKKEDKLKYILKDVLKNSEEVNNTVTILMSVEDFQAIKDLIK
jgi:hypothetical protein